MGLLGKLAEITLKTATLPLDVVVDVFTLGGTLSEDEQSAVLKKCRDIADDIDDLGDE